MTARHRRLEQGKVFAIVGGGRWARVFLSALSCIELPHRMAVVSTANVEQLAAFQDGNSSKFVVVPTVKQLLQEHDVGAAVVVNASRLHFGTASELVQAGVSVLVEKPLALATSDVERLFAHAAKIGAYVIPSLTYLHCSYLDRFAKLVGEHGEPVVGVCIDWGDPYAEVRYGEDKAYDPSISVAQDVMPHIWAILASTLGKPGGPVDVKSCAMERGGRRAQFELSFSGYPCRVAIEREAQARRRTLQVKFSTGQELAIDFAAEPGTITGDAFSAPGDPDWDRAPKPVLRQLQSFLALLEHSDDESGAIEASLGTVALAQRCDTLLKQQQRSWLTDCPVSRIDNSARYAIRDLAGSELYEKQRIRPGDRRALDLWTEETIRRLHDGQYSKDAQRDSLWDALNAMAIET